MLRINLKKLFFPAIIISLMLNIGILFAQQPDTEKEMVKLNVTSTPSNATLVVDRVIRGITPIIIEVERGEHLIRVSVDENWQPFIVNKVIDKDYNLDVKLIPKSSYSYEKGKEAFNKGDYATARENFENSVKVESKITPEAYFFLGILDKKKDDFIGMEKHLKEYIDLNPPHGEFIRTVPSIYPEPVNYGVLIAHYLLGDYYKENYNWAQAATTYKLAIPNREAYINKDLKPTFDNIRKYRDITKKNPENYKSLVQLAYLYELKGMLFQSMMAYRDSVNLIFNQAPDFEQELKKFLN
ncbi:MAG: tetratricopeptide repeat protein [Vulcanimicrobiota bacterium]